MRHNNRKRTNGRRVQVVEVPLKKIVWKNGEPHLVNNDHPKAGKVIQIRHDH